MDKVLTTELKEAIKQHEGIKSNLYLDSKGILTIGIGNNVSKLANFMELNLTDIKDGHTLTAAEKESLFSQIMSDVNSKTFHEKNYSQYHVAASEIENKFNHQLEQSYRELERKIEGFQTLPIPAQQALLDMQFNMGNTAFQPSARTVRGHLYLGWPKLFDAINRHDWASAAQESRRKDVQSSRNLWTYNKFIQS